MRISIPRLPSTPYVVISPGALQRGRIGLRRSHERAAGGGGEILMVNNTCIAPLTPPLVIW